MKEKIITLTQEEADKINKEGKAIGVCIDTLEDEEYKDTLDSGFFPLEKEPIEDIGSEEQDPKEIIDYFDPWRVRINIKRIKDQKIANDWQLPYLYNYLLEQTQPKYYGMPDNFYTIYQKGDYEVIREHLFENIEDQSLFRLCHLLGWMRRFPNSHKRCFWDSLKWLEFDSFNDPKQYHKQEKNIRQVMKALSYNLKFEKADYSGEADEDFEVWCKKRKLELETAYLVGYYKKITYKQLQQRKKFLERTLLFKIFKTVLENMFNKEKKFEV